MPGAKRAPCSASFTTRMETRRLSLLMAIGATMASLPWALARSSGRHRQAKAAEDADRAVVLRAAMPEATAPSRLAELAGHTKSRCQRQGWNLRLANQPCTSICGSIT
jgi:hypothetical protein